MTNPVVSIVIATNNRCHLLQETVAGIFAQTFVNWELIIVDHASDDETWDWLSEQQDSRVTKLRLDEQVKRATARNKGLVEAKGEFVLFLDHDQQLVETALEKHLEALALHPDAVASISSYAEFDQNGGSENFKLVRRREVRSIWPDILFGWIPRGLGQCLFRRQTVNAGKAWHEDLTHNSFEDHALWLQVARLGPMALVPNILCKYRRRRGQLNPPELWKLLTKLRKRAAAKCEGQEYELAQQILQARDDFKSGMKHYKEANLAQAIRFFRRALRANASLRQSPLTRPMLLSPLRKCLVGAPIFNAWKRRVIAKINFPIRHIVTTGAPSLKRVSMRPSGEAWNFWDRCHWLGLEHELRWYWVKMFAAKKWRQQAENYKWIFILGCNNSGTTLVTRLLESHPAISGVPRGGRGATVVLLPPKYANVSRLWTEKLELFRLTEADQHLDGLRLIYDWVAAMYFSNRPYILEKAPPDMVCARWFQAIFPNAYFIGLVRNGYAVVEGMNRREGYSMDRGARHWSTANQVMLEDTAYLKQFMLVRYEDFTQNTKAVMRQVCQFLDIDFKPVQKAVNKEWRVHNMDNQAAKIQNFNAKSFARLTASDLEIINRYAGETLKRFGYKMNAPQLRREALSAEMPV